MSILPHCEREADGEPHGLLILHQGRGSDERTLLALADDLDPERQLHVVSPRAPFADPDWPGYRWYAILQPSHPDYEMFHASYRQLAEFHDELWRRRGIAPERTILGGFSQGAVISYALGLGPDRPPIAGILAFSGFVPTVDDWTPDLAGRPGLRAFITHGSRDRRIDVEVAREARDLLTGGGIEVDYRESDISHKIDPAHIPAAQAWLAQTLEPESSRGTPRTRSS
jgi:phospholipase/carboxylesterase